MKRKNDYMVLILLAFLLIRCGQPLPTELITDDMQTLNDDLTVEVLSPDPGEVDYSNGYDSTGMVGFVPKDFFNIISFSKVTDEYRGMTRLQDFAVAIFFDKTQPVKTPHGRLIGYKTRKAGTVFFNGDSAKTTFLHVRFFDGGMPRQVLLGPKHELRKNLLDHSQSPIADYNTYLNVKLKPDLFPDRIVEGDIPVPQELNAVLKIRGSKNDDNLELILNWNKSGAKRKIEIIIGGVRKGTDERMPLLRVRTKDDGKVIIGRQIINSLPFDRFSHIVITLIRRFENTDVADINNNKILVTSQVIHNLIFDVP